jgi:hypothetical protein
VTIRLPPFERHSYSVLKLRDKKIISFVLNTFPEHAMLSRVMLCIFVLSEGTDNSDCSECSYSQAH